MASLSKRAGFLISANFIKYAVGFCLPMLMVRLLSKPEYGTYQQLLLVNSLALGLMTMGLPSSIFYFYNRIGTLRQPGFVVQTLVLLGMAGLVSTVAIALAAPMIGARMTNPDLAGYLPLYAVAIGLMLAGEHFMPFMVVRDHYGTAVWFETLETFLRVGTLVLPVTLGFGLRGLVVAAVLYALLRFAVRSAWVLRRPAAAAIGHAGAVERPRRFSMLSEQFAYSIPLWLTSIVGVLGGLIDRAIVAASFLPVDYAVYSVGALSIPLDVVFQASVADVLRATLPPLIERGDMQEVTRLLREAVRKLSLIMLPSFVFLCGFAEEFITLVFTNQYADSVTVFRIYLFGLPLYMFVLSLIPQVFGRTRINLNIVIAATTFHVVLSFVLLKTVGFYGPALSAIISGYLGTGVYLAVACRLTKASMSVLLPLRALATTLSCAVLALGAAWLVGVPFSHKVLNFGLQAAVFTVAFVASGLLLNLFTVQDRLLVRSVVLRLRPGRAG